MVAKGKVKVKPPKAKAPKTKSKSKDRKGSEESEQGEAAAAGTDPGGYEEWLGRNTGGYNSSSSNSTLPPIPIEWNISPTNLDSVQCPSVGGTVGWFIATDLFSAGTSFFLLVVLVSLFEPVDKNKKKPNKGCWATDRIWLTWLIGFAFEALGNLINAGIVVTSKGYGKLALGHVFLVYSSRPRIKIWVYAIFRSLWIEEDYSFMTAYFSLAVVEVILHIMSATFVGITWSRYPNEPIKEYMSPVTMYMQVAAGILVLCVLLVAPIWRRSKDPQWLPSFFLDFVLLFLFFGVVYAAPWAYWGMFLQLPGPLWCPPKIAVQGFVWAVFSTLSSGFSI
ncbi:uncharacterized protein NECHADRAFT_77066 [Fusarium vanettenii 77-13-4]|uniref:Uncharacterized protein n=1 Tax=Fusarium vanettenii (strain ATCC MYA-4622 / CBS 123669 / FGSC 9596 / NRRL 45880 / 77-13-4) TaxID=660122 RepID=C7ZCI7_FUSV7|nr:uncharacterized protein NECHADRAFT_77066 [Fusarium vanettenii 77-13-4]EEU38270.1 hypothetical protein NECHADRAFT_77066 [Fusarium vanettenii 77-13-4]